VRFPRSSGILLHPTSLPGKFGVGDLGDEAYRFVDFLASSGQSLWQVLPLGPTGYGDSPYQCFSAFAGNTLLISLERLVKDGLLTADDLTRAPAFPEDRADFGRALEFKKGLLREAFNNSKRKADDTHKPDYQRFCHDNSYWLDDYALYRALKDAHDGKPWYQWDTELVRRDEEALRRARESLSDEIEAEKFYQYEFFKQWWALRSYCHQQRVKIIGDIPIFVAHDSADVWANPEQFKLDEKGEPTVVAGVPPDYFSATGQLWGNPIYNWEQMREDGFRWWIQRTKATLHLFDIIRIDHFRGFAASWEIPYGDKTAERGDWVKTPGRELFDAMKKALGELPVIAEDLGLITPDVEALRDALGFPGMRLLQFAFSGDHTNIHLPHNYIPNMIVYTGTHDNDTTVGWFNSQGGVGSTRSQEQIEREREYGMKYLDTDGTEIHWDFIRAVFASVPDTALIPLQDVLGLGTEARMNLPATTSGNWAWRFRPHALTTDLSDRLRELAALYGRMVV
jgi:4-alpha-glucanotransferase